MPYVTFCTCAKSRDLLTCPKCVTGVILVDDASVLQIRSHDFWRYIKLYVCMHMYNQHNLNETQIIQKIS